MSQDETSVSNLLEQVDRDFQTRPFVPHRIFKQGDAQTIAVHLWPGRVSARENTRDEARLFQVEPGSRVLAYCRWHADRLEHPTLVMWHGMEGSTASAYMLTTAGKAFRAGFNVVRVNFRNCGGTEHLSPTLYHGGLTLDLRVVIDELIAHDRLQRIFIAGFSLGGNMVLKLAGEYGDNSLPVIGRIRIPTLMIHSQDDPFIPFRPLRDPSIAANPYVLLIAPEHGGHVAFMSAKSGNEDRFWAENRLVEFCEAFVRKRYPSSR